LNLAEAASNCHDYAALAFLNPFHMVQVNEEDKISGILAKVRGKFIMLLYCIVLYNVIVLISIINW
jgi:ferritin